MVKWAKVFFVIDLERLLTVAGGWVGLSERPILVHDDLQVERGLLAHITLYRLVHTLVSGELENES